MIFKDFFAVKVVDKEFYNQNYYRKANNKSLLLPRKHMKIIFIILILNDP